MTVGLALLRIPAGLEFHSARSFGRSGPPLGRFLCDQRAPPKPLWPNPPLGGLSRDPPFGASNDLFRGAEDALGELLKPWGVSLGTLLLLPPTICCEAQRRCPVFCGRVCPGFAQRLRRQRGSRQRLLQSEALWRRRPRRVDVSNSLCIAGA